MNPYWLLPIALAAICGAFITFAVVWHLATRETNKSPKKKRNKHE